MKDIDDLIRETLSEEDSRWFDEWDEQSLTEMVVDSFRGKSRWLVILVYVSILVLCRLDVAGRRAVLSRGNYERNDCLCHRRFFSLIWPSPC